VRVQVWLGVGVGVGAGVGMGAGAGVGGDGGVGVGVGVGVGFVVDVGVGGYGGVGVGVHITEWWAAFLLKIGVYFINTASPANTALYVFIFSSAQTSVGQSVVGGDPMAAFRSCCSLFSVFPHSPSASKMMGEPLV